MATRDRAWNVAVVCLLVALVLAPGPAETKRRGHPMTTQVDQFGERNEYNFVADGSFENEISEWDNQSDADGGSGAEWEIDTSWSRSGEHSILRAPSMATSRRFTNSRVFDVVPEQIFHLEAFAPNPVDVGVTWFDEDGDVISEDVLTTSAAGRNFERFIPPDLAVRGQVFLEHSDSTFAGQVDDVFAAQFPSHLAPLAETSPLGTDNDSSTRTNTAFGDLADTANSPSVDFVAPPNGRVLVTVSALAQSSAAGSKAVMGYQIIDLTDSSVFQDASTVRAAASASANEITVTRVAEVPGLVPGRSYRARAKYRSFGAATATFQDRRIIVQPALGVT